MQRVLVIGGSGRLGSSIVSELGRRAIPYLATSNEHSTPTCRFSFDFFGLAEAVKVLFRRAVKVDTVIFAAHVERTPNIKALNSCMKRFTDTVGARRFVYVSSDAVFDGERGNYTETMVTVPLNHYGRNLVDCERIVSDMPNALIVRPSYLYGFLPDGSLDPRLRMCRDTIRKGLPWNCFHDMYKSPLGFTQAAEAIVTLAAGAENGVVHTAGHRMSVYDFYREAMQSFGECIALVQPTSMLGAKHGKDMLRDSSLSCERMVALTGVVPMTVGETLQRSPLRIAQTA